MDAKQYVKNIQEKIHQLDQGQTEYLQAVDEFLPTVEGFLEKNPQYIEANVLGVLIEPERIFQFRVPWQDDQGNWHVNIQRWFAVSSKCEFKCDEVFGL